MKINTAVKHPFFSSLVRMAGEVGWNLTSMVPLFCILEAALVRNAMILNDKALLVQVYP